MIKLTGRILCSRGSFMCQLPPLTGALRKTTTVRTLASQSTWDFRSSKEWTSTLETAKSEASKISDRLTQLIEEVLQYDFIKEVPIVKEHMSKMLPYTVIGGKMARGAAVVTSVQNIHNRPLTPDELLDSRTLGAAIEFLQAHFLVADDIMDGAITRRGEACWYQVADNGLDAINDSLILNSLVNAILSEHFTRHPCCLQMCQLFNRITLLTDLGQSADTLVSKKSADGAINWSMYTMKNYNDIVKYKTAFYTTALPVRLALYYSECTDASVHKRAEDILLLIGHLFRVQDDFFDCYKSAQSLGKIGTDIRNGKCSWPILTALSIASPEQTALLKSNYGKQDAQAEALVKSIYNDLQIPSVYAEFERTTYTHIMRLIDEWQHVHTDIPKGLFLSVFAPLHERSK